MAIVEFWDRAVSLRWYMQTTGPKQALTTLAFSIAPEAGLNARSTRNRAPLLDGWNSDTSLFHSVIF